MNPRFPAVHYTDNGGGEVETGGSEVQGHPQQHSDLEAGLSLYNFFVFYFKVRKKIHFATKIAFTGSG